MRWFLWPAIAIYFSLLILVLSVFYFPNNIALTTCESQRVDYATNPLPGAFIPRCKANGNFEAEQCHGSVCYCVNRNGIPIPGTEVNIGQGRPNCKDPGEHGCFDNLVNFNLYHNLVFALIYALHINRNQPQWHCVTSFADETLTDCERQVQNSLIDGSQFVPRCKRDGTYEDVQCDASSAECWCVDKDGKELPQTRSKDLVKCPDQSKRKSNCLFLIAFMFDVVSGFRCIWRFSLNHINYITSCLNFTNPLPFKRRSRESVRVNVIVQRDHCVRHATTFHIRETTRTQSTATR